MWDHPLGTRYFADFLVLRQPQKHYCQLNLKRTVEDTDHLLIQPFPGVAVHFTIRFPNSITSTTTLSKTLFLIQVCILSIWQTISKLLISKLTLSLAGNNIFKFFWYMRMICMCWLGGCSMNVWTIVNKQFAFQFDLTNSWVHEKVQRLFVYHGCYKHTRRKNLLAIMQLGRVVKSCSFDQ